MPTPYYKKYKRAKSAKDLKANKPMLSWKKDKKMVVLAKKGNKTKVVHFGQKGYSDYTQHGDKKRRERYIARASKIRNKRGQLTKNDIFSPNYWAIRILW